MGLLFFAYFFAVIIILDSVYLKFNDRQSSVFLRRIAHTAGIAALLSAVSISFVMYNKVEAQAFMFKLAMVAFTLTSHSLLNMTFKVPYFEKNKTFSILNFLLHTFGIFLVFFAVGRFSWNSIVSFKFYSKKILPFLTGAELYVYIFLFAVPVVSFILLVVKAFKIKSNIYRQQLILIAFSVLAALISWIVIVRLFAFFPWVFSLFPIGILCVLFISQAAFSLTSVFDLKQILLSFARFIFFTLMFALTAGLAAAFIVQTSPTLRMLLLGGIITSFILFITRDFITKKFAFLLGDTSDYESKLTEELQQFDYTLGRDSILQSFVELMKTRIDCCGLGILITDENGVFKTVYSDFEKRLSIPTGKKCFAFLMNRNVSVITKTEIVANYIYENIKSEMLDVFTEMDAQTIILIREGQKLIGCIGLGAKNRGAEYNQYDIRVLRNIYSYFFLIIYYLSNIAKQDIILTVDREVEMSDQIIGSIQKNMDKIENKAITVGSVSYSAHQLGGDFIDFIKLTEDRFLFLIGDVAGKGLAASMSMVILKSVIHTFLQETGDFKKLIIKINSFVKDNLPRGTFFAGLFGIIDFPTNTVYYLNCGIPLMAMYIQTYQNVIEVQGEGRVLGFVKNIAPFLKVRKITLHPKDVVVFTTDGVLEAQNLRGDRFGNDRVNRILQANKDKNTEEIAKDIYSGLLDFISNEIQDDVTILVMKNNEKP
ncbi:siderophore-interacting protein [Treponema phagedenis]|uniref:SpoIIE family protein phosphatase n=1 Tax=Treponema phagedenis TaxID=162 RepID=A0A0B7GXX5_TREPH|nr:PP2C family protein-serine/threonine phosphatase [Treponema phagedenis]QEJ95626.1 SpoIIE family protein phosphatase [Treponema phagedenis]QEJ98549.1 SpoIIE family protein phosphatase [Treponema phagedenis]QEK01480.1 SpoIIE family protein phosphatase [Treponema phagedenis]QEK04054.1 SpoIIE family protein phosphatase [Treponema phagedenis]QEK06500.1 SpoIIE family protein phosphatase [Treponema phagedenis]